MPGSDSASASVSELDGLRTRVSQLEAERARQSAVIADLAAQVHRLEAAGPPVAAASPGDDGRHHDARLTLEEYHRLTDISSDLVAVVDRGFVYRLANAAFFAYQGLEREQVIGHHVAEVVGEEAFEATIRPALERCFAGETVQFQMQRRYPTLGERYLRVTYTPVAGEDGAITRVAAIIRDITERIEFEQERERLLLELGRLATDLAKERDVLAAITENTATQFAYLDADLRFVRVNSAYAAGSGHAKEELIGRDHFELFPSEENEAIFRGARDRGEPVRYRAKPFRYADQPERGITFWDWTLVPVKDEAGQVQGLVVSLTEVTEAERRAAELEATLAAIAEALLVHDLGGRIVRMNQAAEALFGFSEADKALSLIERQKKTRSVRADGSPYGPGETPGARVVRGDTVAGEIMGVLNGRGEWVWTSVSGAPILAPDGSITGTVVTFTDITKLREAEAHLRRSHELSQALDEIHRLLGASLDPDAVMDGAVDAAARALGADTAVLGLQDGDSWVIRCAYGMPDSVIGSAYVLDEARPTARAAGERRPLLIEDSGGDDCPWPEIMEASGTRALLVLPLFGRGDVGGAISFGYSEPQRFTPAQLEFAGKLAAAIALTLENARLYAVERQRANELEAALAALHRERALLEAVLHQMPSGVIVAEAPSGRLMLGNEQVDRIWRREFVAVSAIGGYDTYEGFHPDGRLYRPEEWPLARAILAGETVVDEEIDFVGGDGFLGTMRASAGPVRDQEGRIVAGVVVFDDITEKRHLEEERAKVNKLESLGVLAGGIAHDFNNLLTGILGNIILARMEAQGQPGLAELLTEAERAATRAKGLTQQLLTFAKGGEPLKRVLPLPDLISEAVSFALRGTTSVPRYRLPADLWPVTADAGQIAQVIQNLAINADQAMPKGGTIRVEAANVTLTGHDPLPLPPGRYVRISVVDEGAGIAREIQTRIFDPYFTTKPRGSGLGLSVVYSIAVKHGGYVTVESEPGRGSRFDVYLPAAGAVVAEAEAAVPAPACRGRILVMDDEDIVLRVACRMLERLGCEVEVAREGGQAVALYARALEEGRPFDAVILDLYVPAGMGGLETLEELRRIDPRVRGVVSSGYSTDPAMARYGDFGFLAAIGKPYSLERLAEVLAAVVPE